jgi:hypothetical protein
MSSILLMTFSQRVVSSYSVLNHCPDDRSGSIQYQDNEVIEKRRIYDENGFKDAILEISDFYSNDL